MGGRGDYLASGGFVDYHYETIDKIDGVKVLHYNDGNQKLPEFSNTSKMYLGTNAKGEVIQLRIYEDRHSSIDFDWGHSHNKSGKYTVHVHKWKDGHRLREPKEITAEQIKRYGSLIKKANPNVLL